MKDKIEVFKLYDFLTKYFSEEEAQNKIKSLIDNGVELSDEELEFQEMESRFKNTKCEYQVQLSFEEDENCQSLVIDDPKVMLDVWLMCLNAIEPSLNLEVASEALSQYFIKYKGYPHEPEGTINYYGYDTQKRHLETPGYGVWEDHAGEFYHDVN